MGWRVKQIDFSKFDFHPVVDLSAGYEVLDLSRGASPSRLSSSAFTVGRYDEDRSIYSAEIFAGGRSIHVGLDIGAPAGTPVHAFAEGRLYCQGINSAPGDYGPTLITHHVLSGVDLWVLHGHLSCESLELRSPGEAFDPGVVLGAVGETEVNGGWPPHLHIQLSYIRPKTHDMPGVVTPQERAAALLRHPDPRGILGSLY
jgi:murein DD-endopeptidase MepM/ murein hydrolase activator NlpD